MWWFNKKDDKEVALEDEDVGVVIQITPVAVYLYISKTGIIYNDDNSSLSFEDLTGNYIEIGGAYISLELDSINDLDNTIAKFGLDNINLPIIKIEIQST